MADSIERFIEKLQNDGVEAGQQEKQRIREEAEKEARAIVDDAKRQANRIVEQAKSEAANIKEQSETELKLAARDTVGRLEETLNHALQRVLEDQLKAQLNNTEFLAELLREVIMQYVRADVEGKDYFAINVSPEKREQLSQWAIQELHGELKAAETKVTLGGTLGSDGFEYQVADGTVEVTAESVAEQLSGFLSDHLHELLQQALKEQSDQKGNA
jgi:vacuolar-type H+-ATPase subunit E/Vma4